MARTTADLVKGILMSDYGRKSDGTLADLAPFIETASSIVDDVVACASDKGLSLTAAKLELIERWIAAHCYVMSDQVRAKKKTGDAEATFQGQTKMHLESSKYGQTALVLDPTGCLASLGNQKVATMTWLGLPERDQTDYDERNL